jgi:hypothetical protein
MVQAEDSQDRFPQILEDVKRRDSHLETYKKLVTSLLDESRRSIESGRFEPYEANRLERYTRYLRFSLQTIELLVTLVPTYDELKLKPPEININ